MHWMNWSTGTLFSAQFFISVVMYLLRRGRLLSSTSSEQGHLPRGSFDIQLCGRALYLSPLLTSSLIRKTMTVCSNHSGLARFCLRSLLTVHRCLGRL